MNKRISEILNYIPMTLRGSVAKEIENLQNIEEIRFRIGKPVSIFTNGKIIHIDTISSAADIKAIFNAICEHSVYAYLEDIKQGFITVKGGHRVGICGRVVSHNGVIENIKDICGLNFRIAHEIIGCSDKLIKYIVDNENNQVKSTLIISPPLCGKTTMLRDVARLCSMAGFNVSVVDCRGEIAASYNGVSQNDLGVNTDVLDGCPKSAGMMMLLRSMAPQVLVTDEIINDDDIFAVLQALAGGVSVIATVHGDKIDDILENPRFLSLFGSGGFKNIVLLSRKSGAGTIEEVRLL